MSQAAMADASADVAGSGIGPSTEKLFNRSILAALLFKLGGVLGLGSLFEFVTDAGETVATVLPWLSLALAAFVVIRMVMASPHGVTFGVNRYRRHIIGWLIGAVILLILAFFGDALRPVLDVLGKSGKVIANFGGNHGIFLALIMLMISGALSIVGSDRTSHHQPGKIERVWVGNLTAKIAAIPMALVAMGIFFGGTVWTVIYSFTGSKLLPKAKWVGLDQYERLWGESRWITSIENLMIYGFFSLIFSLVIGFFLAVLLDQKIRFENTFRTIFLYPFALSFIVTGLVWQWVLNPDFGVQSVIRKLGFTNFDFDPLYNADIVIYGILIAGLWQGTGLIMCLMLAGLRGIDEDIWKASRVDGIPAWKTYIFIIIPMMRPVFITTLVLIASGIVRVYDLVVAQTSGGPGIASEVPAKYVYDKMFLGQNLGQGFAASTMMLLAVLVVIIPWAYLEFGGRKQND